MNKFYIKSKVYKSSIQIGVYLKSRSIGSMKLLYVNNLSSYISYLNVSDRYMNKGIGTFLIRESIRISKAKEYEGISLHVDIDNTNAIRLYKRLGFFTLALTKEQGNIKAHYLMVYKL